MRVSGARVYIDRLARYLLTLALPHAGCLQLHVRMDVHSERVKQTCWCITPSTRDMKGVKSQRAENSKSLGHFPSICFATRR